MIIVILGASGSGKSIVEKCLVTNYGFNKIVPYTTREPREGEVNGEDYYFVSEKEFNEMLNLGVFAEHSEYSRGRRYGTLRTSYIGKNNDVVILTPDGLRQIKNNIGINDNMRIVLLQSSLGTRIKRYIDRIGVDKFSYDDKNEIASRVERDYSMFLGIEREVDIIIQNEDTENISNIVRSILDE